MRVRFTGPARADLQQIAVDIGETDPVQALQIVERIEADAGALKDFPERFPVVRKTWMGEVRKMRTRPYLLFYRVSAGEVQLLRVAHERSDWVGVVARIG